MSTGRQKTIKELRGDSMSQFALAVRVGVSPSTVAGIEQGRQEPRVHLAMRIADVFGVRVEDISWPDEAELEKYRKKGRAAA